MIFDGIHLDLGCGSCYRLNPNGDIEFSRSRVDVGLGTVGFHGVKPNVHSIQGPAGSFGNIVDVAHHRTDYNLYEGWQLKGFPVKVFLRGQLIVDGEQWLGKPGMGQFINRNEGGILR